MPPRHDVASVPLQDAYVAKRCPVRAQNYAVLGDASGRPSPPLERRLEQGRQFEREIISQLFELHPDACAVQGRTVATRTDETLAAVRKEAQIILGAQLPPDLAGRRVGRPDVLVRSRSGGYRPIEIKHHMALEPAPENGRGLPASSSSLKGVTFENARLFDSLIARKNQGDLLQLAHYQKLLEVAGLAASGGRYAGIIGVERQVVWHDLDSPMWRTPSASAKSKLRSSMERYDFEFDFRLDILAVAEQHLADPEVELLVVPVRISECDECPWFAEYCKPELESGSGDVSLLPRVGWREWKIHRDRSVFNRADLAALDSLTPRLVLAGVNVPAILPLIEGLPEQTPIADLGVVIHRAQLAKLSAEGIRTFGELNRLCATTASYFGAGLNGLLEQIDLARAALGDCPVYLRRGVESINLPRANVEVDVDMENIEEGVYLWGALKTDRAASAAASEYHGFVTWEPLSPAAELDAFRRFWDWLTEIRAAAHDSGRTFRAYCYNASAENQYLRKLGTAAGIIEHVKEFIDSEEWVDMLRVVERQLISGTGMGLKAVAPLAGFSWEVDGAGGGESMVQYDRAVLSGDPDERQIARTWLLAYNEGDVAATLATRDWLERAAESIPPIESLER